MTTEKCLAKIKIYKKNYDAQVTSAKNEYETRKKIALNKWAEDNAEFGIGDIIQYHDIIIKVDKIKGYCSTYSDSPIVVYYGNVLTKSLSPCKDGSKTTIWADGRPITKLK